MAAMQTATGCQMAAVQRAKSCPPSLDVRLLLPTDRRTQGKHPHTLSVNYMDESSSAYSKLGNIHRNIMSKSYVVAPTVETEFFHNKLYVMIRLNLLEPHPNILRPHLMHITCAVAYLSCPLYAVIEAWTRLISTRIDALFQTLSCPTVLNLVRAPWTKSWNFGLDDSWLMFLNAFRLGAEYIVVSVDGAGHIRAQREWHVSWQ